MAAGFDIPDYGLKSLKAKRARNLGPLKQAVFKRFKRLWRDAARVFLVTASDAMSVDSGMSVASLQAIGAKIQIKKFFKAESVGFGPKFYGYDGETVKDGVRVQKGDDLGSSHVGAWGNRSRNRGDLMGKEAVKRRLHDITYGSPNNMIMTFTFQAVVYQHIYWELTWDSLGKGETAMLAYVDDNFDRAPYEVTELAIRWLETGDNI